MYSVLENFQINTQIGDKSKASDIVTLQERGYKVFEMPHSFQTLLASWRFCGDGKKLDAGIFLVNFAQNISLFFSFLLKE